MQQAVSAQTLMLDFAASTGLSEASRAPRRYLWTDAFAVCNFLELYRQTGEEDFLQLALKLVGQVHRILGQEREDSGRSGWLSGFDEEQARRHPTRGGLRIGKKLNERQASEPANASLEWEQDGQYFHYLTKWMHALNRVSQVTGKSMYNQWGLELAKGAHAAFTYTASPGESKRMYWKMSIDLSRPLVASMGQHDPLDALMTYWQLEATSKQFPETPAALGLKTEIEEMLVLCADHNWASEDPLGIGGLLTDAHKLVQLIDIHHLDETARLELLLRDSDTSLHAWVTHNPVNLPAEYRLPFRELGLAIGLHTISRMQERIEQKPRRFSNAKALTALLTKLSCFRSVHHLIERFWLEPAHQSVNTWREHTEINRVMLATSLAPDGYLLL